jgi:phosphatidylglycerophosphatase A
MTLKESSDELNPPAITGGASVTGRQPRSAKDYLALVIATCGVGYLPIAPGTWGSLLAVGLYLFARGIFLPYADSTSSVQYAFVTGELVLITTVTFVGIWAASRTERVLKIKDPGKVVVDEVAGQLIALLPLGLGLSSSWPVMVVVAFMLFRFFDIVKPYPARRMESLKGGLGIMADDLVAGAYAAIVVAVTIIIQRFIQEG